RSPVTGVSILQAIGWGPKFHQYPKPPIWVSPSRVVALGGSVTIRCEGRYQGMEFFLHKAGNQNPQVQSVYFGTVAEFPIPSVGREDGGSYTCDYRPITAQNRSSYLSDPVEIIVGGEGGACYPKPNITLRPSGGVSLGGAMTVQCRGQHQGVQFVLNKERRHFPPVDSDRFEVVFPISNVRREHGGSYSCSYHSRSEPFAVSYPSDPMELVVRGEGPGSASPFPAPPPARPSWGLYVTIWCQGQYWYVRFFLHKAGDLNPQRHMDPAGDTAEFHIPNVGRQHGGNYSCSYRPRSEPFVSSQPSDPVELVVGSYPKPSISVSPGGVIPVGGNITIRCQHQHLGMRFLLYKAGVGKYLNYTDPAGYMAEFPITSARREHGGSYTCRYSNRTIQTAYSEPSDPVQIIVAGQGPSPAPRLPAPHPARPQQMGRPAQALKVGWRGDISAPWRFGDLDPRGDPDPVSAPSLTLHAGDGAQWPCRGLSHAPSPSHCRAQLPQTLHLPEPQHGGVTLGGAVTIRCRGQRRGLEFVLDKAGARNAAAPGGDSAGIKFPIPKASRADGGSNTCYYPHDSDPDRAGGPSSQLHTQTDPWPSRGDARPGSRDRVIWGFPIQGEKQPLEIQG
uniref:Ig-like domain-containing protein n=1 Tax=Chrysemys picta bellii TaxID=8478 RepID=A0A8C3HWN4_CHRPI